jgi:hypothetical protein
VLEQMSGGPSDNEKPLLAQLREELEVYVSRFASRGQDPCYGRIEGWRRRVCTFAAARSPTTLRVGRAQTGQAKGRKRCPRNNRRVKALDIKRTRVGKDPREGACPAAHKIEKRAKKGTAKIKGVACLR